MKLVIDIPDEYVEQIKNNTEGATAESEAVDAIRNGLPYENQPQGEWLKYGDHAWKCSKCNCSVYVRRRNFCPDCGAKMIRDA